MYTPQREDPGIPEPPLIAPVAQPKGLEFFLKTWTGRIILINTVVYFLTAMQSNNWGLTAVDGDVLLRYGAKDSVRLAQGEYWRLITPMFVHGGFLHYALNNWALYVLGYQLESMLNPRRYLLLYLVAGTAGSAASALTSLMPSVGASGALFGLLGCGFYVERLIQTRIEQTTGYKPRRGAYTGMVVANILFGLIIPQIDNAAHIGGLIAGVTFAYVLLRVRPNRLLPMQVRKGWLVAGLVSLIFVSGALVGSSPDFVLYRLRSALSRSQKISDQYYYLNRLLELDPQDKDSRLSQFRLALRGQDYKTAENDLLYFQARGLYEGELLAMSRELDLQGLDASAEWLRERLAREGVKLKQSSTPTKP